jgi:hypothetical protein
MCKKVLPDGVQQCPRCNTDLSLLTDYVGHLHDGLARAETLTRQGELGEAVWAYLDVLEVDPDNAAARRQIGRVATAVRQFDRTSSSRRWLARLGRQARLRYWLQRWFGDGKRKWWLVFLGIIVLLILVFFLGYQLGFRSGKQAAFTEMDGEVVAS